MSSREQRERLQIDTSEIISKNNKFTKDWEEAFRVARKRTYRSSDTQMDNLQKRQHIDLSSNPTPTRVVTPTDELVQGPSPVTPSPPKKRIRRPGCELPSRMIPITPTEQTEQKPKEKIGVNAVSMDAKTTKEIIRPFAQESSKKQQSKEAESYQLCRSSVIASRVNG